MQYIHKTILTMVIAISGSLSSAAWAENLPVDGINVQPLQSTAAEETLQALIVNKARQALSYAVNATKEVDYNVAYTSIAAGDATYLAVNCSSLNNSKYEAAGGDVFIAKVTI